MKQSEKKDDAQVAPFEYRTAAEFIGNDTDTTPELEPLFANHFEILSSGTDIYLDIGVIAPSDMIKMMELAKGMPGRTPTVRFSVLQRVAMSPATFTLLMVKINGLMDQIKKQMETGDNASKNSSSSK